MAHCRLVFCETLPTSPLGAKRALRTGPRDGGLLRASAPFCILRRSIPPEIPYKTAVPRFHRRLLQYTAGALCVALASSSAVAQAAPDSAVAPRAAEAPLITKRQAVIGAFAVAASVGLAQVDTRIESSFQNRRLQGDDEVHATAWRLAFLGGPGPFLIGSGLIAVGVASRSSGELAAGRRITESVLLAASINALAKGFFGRALPGVQTNHCFEFARGFHRHNGGFVAFPSGHTAAGFALAQATVEETERDAPGMVRFVAPAAYLTATGIGVARLYQHVHWPSDLPVAAAIGLWSGRTVALRSKDGKRSAAQTVANGISAVPMSNQRVLVSWSSLLASR